MGECWRSEEFAYAGGLNDENSDERNLSIDIHLEMHGPGRGETFGDIRRERNRTCKARPGLPSVCARMAEVKALPVFC